MSAEYPPDFPRKIVTARKPKHDHRPIIAVTSEWCMAETLGDKDGHVFPASELPQFLKSQPSSIIVCQGFGKHLQRLQREYEDDPEFNYRITPIHRYSRPWNDGRKLKQGMIVDSVCNFIGWRTPNKRDPNRYHFPLDPIWFLTTGIDELNDSDESRLAKLYKWAMEVREWCKENQLQIKASAGGIAAQLLRDPRFWPNPRRKVPRLVNDIARYQLPGNYYRLHGERGRYYRAIVLDMNNAHHFFASILRFPDPNSLYAYGYWGAARAEGANAKEETSGSSRETAPRAFCDGKHPILRRPGLFHCRLASPHIPSNHFAPPYMERPGEHDVFLYSNELELIESLGGKITKVYSALVSEGEDKGLNRYAKFALKEIREHREWKPWLKPTLHAAYGLLAARPVAFETGYLRATGGEPTEYHMGNVSIPVRAKKRPAEIESRIANVIYRGMIEAEVRKQALWFARYLTEVDRRTVLAIYADAIFIADNKEDEDGERVLPLMQPPWRISKTLTSLRFHSATTFTSPQLTRLPGIPRNARERFLRNRELFTQLNGQREERSRSRKMREKPMVSAEGS